MRILMLAPLMSRGFGLSQVIASVAVELEALGVSCDVGCLDADDTFTDVRVHRVSHEAVDVQGLVDAINADVVIAHGSPYFEVLPHLSGVRTIAYEHGEPPPELFADRRERAERVRIKENEVYRAVDEVIAISEFIRADIDWPEAQVVLNGCDHVPDEGTKSLIPARRPGDPLRIGLLMRLGEGEAAYKGNEVLPHLRELVAAAGVEARWEVMGRGKESDRRILEESGLVVHLNATDEERTRFLRGIDVFISLSLWEGCNLPLVEAQALGTPGLALDTGAHPEFTPLVFPSHELMAAQVARYSRDPALLRAHGELCYRYVRSGMSWAQTAVGIIGVLDGMAARRRRRRPVAMASRAVRGKWRNARDLYREEGPGSVARTAWRKVRGGSEEG